MMYLRIVFTLANSVGPDEMLLYAAFSLGLHCLSKNPFRVSNIQKQPKMFSFWSSCEPAFVNKYYCRQPSLILLVIASPLNLLVDFFQKEPKMYSLWSICALAISVPIHY